jgi:hypothetical protein
MLKKRVNACRVHSFVEEEAAQRCISLRGLKSFSPKCQLPEIFGKKNISSKNLQN